MKKDIEIKLILKAREHLIIIIYEQKILNFFYKYVLCTCLYFNSSILIESYCLVPHVCIINTCYLFQHQRKKLVKI